jgi:elongator complex protein 3
MHRRDTYRSTLDIEAYRAPLTAILRAIIAHPGVLSRRDMERILRQHPRDGSGFFRRDDLIRAYRAFAGTGDLPPFDPAVLERIRLKPTRTISGVTPLTVLTKPFPCPGECIFCPNDVRMPKSYLADEPGAQRAEQNAFDPYLQTVSRLRAYYNTGHPTDKVEVIILGGTWSFYPETYQVWFVKRIFDALNDFGQGVEVAAARAAEVEAALREGSQFRPSIQTLLPQGKGLQSSSYPLALRERGPGGEGHAYNHLVQSLYAGEMRRSRALAQAVARGERARTPADEYASWEELEAAHRANEQAACRCVGLVVETRPDHIDAAEVLRIRRLGCTKVQIGVQSLNDTVLRLNKRGHDVAATRRAFRLLRAAGFKIHAHWMPNLYGASPQADMDDYVRLFDAPDFRPDELKIYPCSLVESATLMDRYRDGSWRPYTRAELLDVLVTCLARTPEYCRLTRIVRDIPSTDIVAGEMTTNLRQDVETELARRGLGSGDIRLREVRRSDVAAGELHLDEQHYATSTGEEVFLQMITAERRIAAFLRLSLPTVPPLTPDLGGAAVIREVHVYGQSLGIGEASAGKAQHTGLGTQLIERAAAIARGRGYRRLAVISAVGTRAYYRRRGFADGTLYQIRDLAD